MRHLKSEFDKLTIREFITYSIAVACMVAAVISIYLSLYIPPEGEIHTSVLTYFGISSAFCGSLLGISIHYSNELQRFKSEITNTINRQPATSNQQPYELRPENYGGNETLPRDS